MLGNLPSLEPRGPKPHSNSALVGGAAAGIFLGVFRLSLTGLDMFGRGEAAIDIYKFLPQFLQFIGHPAFSAIALASGFVVLIFQGRDSGPIPITQLVHPDTKLPIRSKPQVWPRVRQPTYICIVGFVVAFLAWASYRTPLRFYVHSDKALIVGPYKPLTPPDIPTSLPTNANSKTNVRLHTSTSPSSSEPQVVAKPPAINQSVASHDSSSLRQQQVAPLVADSSCPKDAGRITGEWSIATGQNPMGNAYNLNYSLDQGVVQSLFLLLRQSIHVSTKVFSRAQSVKAINLSDDTESHIPKPTTIQINKQSITPELTLTSIRRSFLQDPDYLRITYSARLPNGQTIGENQDKILIANLSSNSQETIREFDQITKSWGDADCKSATERLTRPQ